MRFLQRFEKIPQATPLCASKCANFSPHSLIVLASMSPICLRIRGTNQSICSARVLFFSKPTWAVPPEQFSFQQKWRVHPATPTATLSLCSAALSIHAPEAHVALCNPDWPFPLSMDPGPFWLSLKPSTCNTNAIAASQHGHRARGPCSMNLSSEVPAGPSLSGPASPPAHATPVPQPSWHPVPEKCGADPTCEKTTSLGLTHSNVSALKQWLTWAVVSIN